MREIFLVYVWFLHAHVDQGNKKVKELAIYFFFYLLLFLSMKKRVFPSKKEKQSFFILFLFWKKVSNTTI